MSVRVVKRELLDHLDPADPEAIRSRRDLRFINSMMGNSRWIEAVVQRFAPGTGIVEIGAGEGLLCQRLAARFPNLRITGIDLAPPPAAAGQGFGWKRGNLFTILPECDEEMLAGSLIVHHFTDESLRDLGRLLEIFRVVALCEPRRSSLAHILGGALHPLINRVTRHDMHVSIDAGFVPGELPGLLGLDGAAGWTVEESSTLFGALHMVAWRD